MGEMTGKRRSASPYPPRVHPSHGALYYVYNNRWQLLVRGLEWNKQAAEAYAKAHGDTPMRGTFAELARDYLDEIGPDMAPRTRLDADAEIANLNKFFGRQAPHTIKPEHVGLYKRGRGKKARVRCNRELSRLRGVLAFGLELGWVRFNAAAGIKPWKERPRDRLISDEEYAAFRAFALAGGEGDRVCFACAELAYLTTQRRASVLAIALTDITADGVWFEPKKGGKRVLVRWTDRLRAAVEAARTIRTTRLTITAHDALIKVTRLSAWLLCTRRGKPYTDSGIKGMWNRLQVRWQAAGHERFHFHDTRARGISKLKEQGRQAREISGHKNEGTAERVYDRRKTSSGDAVE